jgi:hypothetical protein
MAMADWELVVEDPDSADLDQQGDTVRVTIRARGARAVLLRARGAGRLARGAVYVLRLDVRADPARQVEAAIREPGGAARAVLDAAPRWSRRIVRFRIPPGRPAPAFHLEFALGSRAGTFEFDNLSLTGPTRE